MPWILAAVFAVIGIGFDRSGLGMAIAGGLIGYLLGRQRLLERRLKQLEQRDPEPESASAWLSDRLLAQGERWDELFRIANLWLPAMAVFAWIGWTEHPDHHLLTGAGWVIWPASFAGLLMLLAHGLAAPPRLIQAHHLGGALLLIGAVSLECVWLAGLAAGDARSRFEWLAIATILTPTAVLAALSLSITRPRLLAGWPLREWPATYGVRLPAVLAPVITLWWLSMHLAPGRALGVHHIPVLNPVELTQLLAMAAMAAWLHRMRVEQGASLERLPRHLLPATLLGAALVQLTVMLGRGVHHYLGVPYDAAALFDSTALQTATSLGWSLAALGLMIAATRRHNRMIWWVAAGLLGAVVLKLFVIDLADSGTLARVVSFMGVGALMLIAGWRWPIPARPPAHEEV